MKRIGLLMLIAAMAAAVENASAKTPQSTTPGQPSEGLSKSDWSSIRAAHTAWEHSVMPVEDGWQACNKGQQWTTHFDGRGFTTTPQAAAWQWGLELRSYGFGAEQTTVGGQPEVMTEGGHMNYQWDARMREWFINDQRGLEHGFELAERPAGAKWDVPLEVVLAVRGNLRAGLSGDGQTVYFRDELGAPVVNYGGLKVWDADGRVLVSRFVLGAGGAVVLQVEEGAARYPLTIDPIAQQAYLKPNDPLGYAGAGDQLGYSVAVSGDTVVVGAPGESSSTTGANSTPNENAYWAGAAYIFVRSGSTWIQQAYLKASQVTRGDSFGFSVAVSGDTVVVGAPEEDSSTTGVNSTPNESASDAGAAYVFVRSGSIWSQQAYLKANQVDSYNYFGSSVAVSGNTVVVGAWGENSNSTGVNSTPDDEGVNVGAAYVYVLSENNWSQQAYLKASHVSNSDWFGYSVAVSRDTVLVGVPGEDSSTNSVNSTPDDSASDAGAAYVFVRSGSIWSQQAYLKASQVTAGDGFGSSVAASWDTVVVGAPKEDSSTTGVNSTPDESASNAGAAYVFFRSGSTWSQQAYLKANQVDRNDGFGSSVAMSGDTVVVGAYGEDSSSVGVNSTPNEGETDAGAAYVFVRSGTTWSQQAYLKAGQITGADAFGTSVAVDGTTVVVGASFENSSSTGVNSTPNENVWYAGAAYVFERGGAIWSQQAYLKPSDPLGYAGADDQFGYSVAVDGDTVVVGAPWEDSSTTGVNSTPDEKTPEAGAAYVFVRSGSTWTQQAYLKASRITWHGYFGASVAVSGDTVVVGAYGAASIPNGGATSKGSAYVFVRSESTWIQQADLIASQAAVGNGFGFSVAVSGNTVVVGARGDNSGTTGVNSTPNERARNSGAAYIFVRSGSTWSQQAYLKASQVDAYDEFGTSVAVYGDTVVIGALGEDSSTTGINSTPDEDADDAGAAYVFVRSGTMWSQQAYLKASHVSYAECFGTSVALDGNTVVVGAPGEASSTTGVNSTPDESAWASGAAYVFVRIGTTWSQQAYLKASQVDEWDEFGTSVAIAGNMVVVGAPGEASSTTGVNSAPDESAPSAGAAYVFIRSGGNWSQQAYLKAGQVDRWDDFGASVAVSGDTVVAGAPLENSGTTGVNSTPDENAPDAGAAYIFTGFGSSSPEPEIAVSANGAYISDGGMKDFGSITIGSSKQLVFTIQNTGGATLTGLAITKDGANVADFNVGTLGSASVPAGGSTTFAVTFTPGAAGTRSASIRIDSNDADENPFDINLIGTGEDPNQNVAAAIDQLGVNVTNEGQATWFWQSDTTHDGIDAAQSGVISDSQSSSFSLTTTGPGTVSFWWKVSSEENFDFLSFYIDGEKQDGEISGNVDDWQQKSYTINAGSHTLRWTYSKDSSESHGSDCGWVDQVVLPNGGPTPLENWRQTHFGSPADSGDGANSNDFDNDGIPNLLEFAFGLHPKQNSAGLLPKPQSTGGSLVLTFTQPAAVSGITYDAEWSPSMAAGSWQSLTNSGTPPQHTFSTPIDVNTKKFVRLKVSVQ